nr:hypothetical protein [Xanthomonas vasicola]
MIGGEQYLPRVLDDGLRHAHFLVVEIQQGAVQIDTGNADHPEIHLELTDQLHRRLTGHALVAPAHHATGHDHLEAGVGAEHHRDVEVVGDHPQPAVLQQRTRNFLVGGAKVDKQRSIVGNETRHTRGDMLLFAGLQRFACGIGEIFHAGRHADAAVIAAQHAGIAEQGQIAPDGLRRHLKAGGQAFHVGKALLPHQRHQLLLARV